MCRMCRKDGLGLPAWVGCPRLWEVADMADILLIEGFSIEEWNHVDGRNNGSGNHGRIDLPTKVVA